MTYPAVLDKLRPRDPATLEPLGEFEITPPDRVAAAVARARAAFASWGALPVRERAACLRRVRARLGERSEEIARAITRSSGKPLVESLSSEVFPVAYLFDTFLKRAPGMLRPRKVPLRLVGWSGRKSAVEFRPLGVVGIIAPWNYPFSIPVGDMVLALLAGCTVVLKPSEHVPLVGRLIDELFSELPPGVVTVVQGAGPTGAALVEARPDKVVFTGSGANARRVLEAAARHLTPCVLELGGKDPMIVADDAELPNVADAAVWGCFTNSGQVCASVKRVYVVRDIADAFIERVVRATRALRLGDPLDPETDIGAMIGEGHLERVRAQIASAVREGARVLTGGRRPDRPGAYLEPCVLEVEDPGAAVLREEIFGPVLPIHRVNDLEEAVRLANDSPFGLTASVWTRDLRRGRAIARRLEAGTVSVNECTYTHAVCEAPWGGVKESGFGRTRGELGLLEFVQPVHLHENRAPGRRSLWWFPYDASLGEVMRAGVRFYTGGGWGAVRQALKHFRFDRLRPPVYPE